MKIYFQKFDLCIILLFHSFDHFKMWNILILQNE